MSRPGSLPFPSACLALVVFLSTTSGLQAQWFKKRQELPTPTPAPMHPLPPPVPANPYANPGRMLTAMPVAAPDLAAATPSVVSSLPETLIFRPSEPYRPSYELPYRGYRFERRGSQPRGFFSSGKPSDDMLKLLAVIRERAETISTFRLPYVFGGDHPKEGGLDCSGAMKFLLSDIGFPDLPRTSFDQYAWLRKARTLRHTKSIPEEMGGRKGIKPGDLIFWGGTYDSGHRVSHVMLYLGQGKDGTHYMFGARGKNKTGLNGSGVDIFKLESGYQKGLIGFGSLPGVS